MRPHTQMSVAGGWDTSAPLSGPSDTPPRLQAAARILLPGGFRGLLTWVEAQVLASSHQMTLEVSLTSPIKCGDMVPMSQGCRV